MTRRVVRSEPDCSASLEPFLQRLADIVARCNHAADPADPRNSLRPPDRRPRTLERGYFGSVRSVAAGPWLRSQSTAKRGDLSGGRLLVYFPDADLCDGAAEAESGGFFDVFNAPPWATWVAFAADDTSSDSAYAQYLIAYVPEVFIDACTAGIEVNPEECILWLEDTDVGFADLLRRHCPDLLWRR